jgi:hypothetical protein
MDASSTHGRRRIKRERLAQFRPDAFHILGWLRANAAKEVGGSLIAHSEGLNKGSSPILEPPIQSWRNTGLGVAILAEA